jgi:hypothetical protein
MIKNYKPQLFIFIVFIFFGIGYFIFDIKRSDRLFDKLRNEYPFLAIEDSVYTIVADIYIMPFGYGLRPKFKRITTADNKKYAIDTKYCINLKDTYLENEMNIGDSIKKTAGSDTLVVINNKGKYLFKLEKSK